MSSNSGKTRQIYADYFTGLHRRETSGLTHVWRSYLPDQPRVRSSADTYLTADTKDVISAYYPLIGPYDVLDEDVREYHALLAKTAGIDGFLCEWTRFYSDPPRGANPGVVDVSTRTVQAIAETTAKSASEQAFTWSNGTAFRWYGGEQFATRADYLAQIKHDICRLLETVYEKHGLWVGRRPVVPLFDVYPHPADEMDRRWFTPEELEEVRAHVLRVNGYAPLMLVRPWGQGVIEEKLIGVADGFHPWHTLFALAEKQWPFTHYTSRETQNRYLDTFYQECRKLEAEGRLGLVMGCVTRGFDDHKGLSWGVGNKLHIPHDGGRTLEDSFTKLEESGTALAMIATWNDWEEATIVEPTREFGYRDIEICARRIARWKGLPEPNPQRLRYPERLYRVRKAVRLLRDAGSRVTALEAEANAVAQAIAGPHDAERPLDALERDVARTMSTLTATRIDVSWSVDKADGLVLVDDDGRTFVNADDKTGVAFREWMGFAVDDATRERLKKGRFVGTLVFEFLDEGVGYLDAGVDAADDNRRTIASIRKTGSRRWRDVEVDVFGVRFVRGIDGQADIAFIAQGDGPRGGLRRVHLRGLAYRDRAAHAVEAPPAPPQVEWVTQIAGTGPVFVSDVLALDDDSAVVTGEFWGEATFDEGKPTERRLQSRGECDLFLARYAPTGALLWAVSMGGEQSVRGLRVECTPENRLRVRGMGFGRVHFSGDEHLDFDTESAFEARYDLDGQYVSASAQFDEHDLFGAPHREATTRSGGTVVASEFQFALPLRDLPARHYTRVTRGPRWLPGPLRPGWHVARRHHVGRAGHDWATAIASSPKDDACYIAGSFEESVTFSEGVALRAGSRCDAFVARYHLRTDMKP